MLTRDEVDEIAVDGYLCHLVCKQSGQSKDEERLPPEPAQVAVAAGTRGIIIGMAYLGQLNKREHHGYEQHENAHYDVWHHHVAAVIGRGTTEEKLPHTERSEHTAQAVERL